MFLFREGDPTGTYLIPQASHSWLAWQVAEHWGNRTFVRPAPRAEVLAAVARLEADGRLVRVGGRLIPGTGR